MHQRDRYWRSLYAIGVITILLGVAQILFPTQVIELLGAAFAESSRHFLTFTGVSFCLFGAMLINALRDDSAQYVAVLWSGVFHVSMAVVLGAGVRHTFPSAYALVWAVFELCAGAMIIAYWFGMKQLAQEAAG